MFSKHAGVHNCNESASVFETARVQHGIAVSIVFPHEQYTAQTRFVRNRATFGAVKVVKITLRVRINYYKHYRFAVIGFRPLFVLGWFFGQPLIGFVSLKICETRDFSKTNNFESSIVFRDYVYKCRFKTIRMKST